MIILMKALNEERVVDRVIGDFHDEKWVERVIVIDGGSTDYTVQELKKFKKVEVFVHPWCDGYHDMETMQSNVALSYVPHGEIAMILDFDEKMSPELKNFLAKIGNIMPVGSDIANVSRGTFEVMRHEDSPHAIIGEDGWPIISHQIGQYPDYQPRLIKKDPRLHWVNSPHHVMFGWPGMVQGNIDADIIHYEKDDYRDRLRIERKWARAQSRRKMLGLPHDVFGCTVRPEVHKYTDPEEWK